MKILHIVPTYVPAYKHGGPILSVHNLNKKLVELGVDITVYTTDINGKGKLDVPLNKEVLVDGVRVFYFPSRGIFRLWSYSPELYKAIKQNIQNFDIVHITSVFLAASTLGAVYSKKFRKPYIISPRGSLMSAPLTKKNRVLKKMYVSLLEENNLRGASAIHFTAEQEFEEYKKASLPLQKSIIIPNSIETASLDFEINPADFRTKYNIPPSGKIILFLGRLNWKKGFDTLIPAFAKVTQEKPNSVLVIAGPDENNYKKEIIKMIRHARLTREKVIFTGLLLGEDKVSALKSADVFVLPSYSENFGMAVIEALYCKLSIVITKGVALASLIEKSKSGLVIDKNEENVKNGIIQCLQNTTLAKEMGENGKRLVEQMFSTDAIGKKWQKTYEEIIQL